MKYREHGEKAQFIKEPEQEWRHACCDCGLVHDVKIVPYYGLLLIQMNRNNRATAAKRRKRRAKKENK